MKKIAFAFVTALTLCTGVQAQTTPTCDEEVLFRFFPREFVVSALQQEGIPLEKAQEAADVLVAKDRDVIERIEKSASKMSPNPLQQHGNPSERAKLFKAAITAVFTETVAEYDLKDPEQVNKALQLVQQKRLQRFEECKSRGLLPTPQR